MNNAATTGDNYVLSVWREVKAILRQGTVRGKLAEEGWGADLGYPGLILDPTG